MSPKAHIRFSVRTLLYLAILISVPACGSAATLEPPTTVRSVTPTPEIFNSLNPSPTPSDSTLPMTCQVTDLNVYVNEVWGYCFAYPMHFTTDESMAADGIISLYGLPLEDNADPLRVSLEVTTQLVPEGSSLVPLVDAYLTSFHDLPWTVTREPAMLGSDPAEKLEPIPGLLSSRVLMALHSNILFTLHFHPVDIEFAKPDLDALTQAVTGSFAFLLPAAQPASQPRTVSWYEFGRNISLSYDPILAPWVEGWTVPAIPVNDQIFFAEAHPTYGQIRFLGFQGGRPYDLPLLPLEDRAAQVRIFQTADFPGFGDDHPEGFVNQLQALKELLQNGVDPASCAQPLTVEPGLPFLPWINMKQSFCAQPQIIEFADGKGIRYLSYYAQGPGPVLDRQVFYTFQGLTDDEMLYVSALFPIETGIFPTELPPCPNCGDPNYDPLAEWTAVLTDQLERLNAQAKDDFAPSLKMLDEVIQSIQIGQ